MEGRKEVFERDEADQALGTLLVLTIPAEGPSLA